MPERFFRVTISCKVPLSEMWPHCMAENGAKIPPDNDELDIYHCIEGWLDFVAIDEIPQIDLAKAPARHLTDLERNEKWEREIQAEKDEQEQLWVKDLGANAAKIHDEEWSQFDEDEAQS